MMRSPFVLVLVVLHGSIAVAQRPNIAETARKERARRVADAQASKPAVRADVSFVRAALVDDVFRVAGKQPQIEQALKNGSKTFDPRRFIPGVAPARMQRYVDEAMDANRLMPLVKNSVAAAIDAAVLMDVAKWYASPFGARIARAETEAVAASKDGRIQGFASSLRTNPPSTTRQRLVAEIDQYTRASENNIQFVLSASKGLYAGAIAAGGRMNRPPPNFENTLRAQTFNRTRQDTTLSLLYTYRTFSDAELPNYVAFLKTNVGVKFENALSAGISASGQDAGHYLGRKLAELQR